MLQFPVIVTQNLRETACFGSPRAARALPSFFRWDDDLSAIGKKWKKDSVLNKAFSRFEGIRIIRQDPWSCLAGFILSICSNIPKIETTIEKLSGHYKKNAKFLGASLYRIPSAEEIAATREAALRNFGMGFRAKYLKAAAKEVANGFDLEKLKRLPYSEAQKNLMGLFGVGEKVADCVLLFSLEHLEAFPVDVWMKRILENFYFGGKTKTEKYLSAWGRDKFGKEAGYAQQYLYTYGRSVLKSPRP